MIWLILAILTLATLLYLCAPLYSADAPSVVGEDIDAYRVEAKHSSPKEAVNFERQLLKRARPKPVQTAVSRGWLGTVFIGSIVLAAGLYGALGSPKWASSDLPRMQPRPAPASDADAIAQMSPEDRAAMIDAMVEGLAARLREDPEDVDGWVRLLRSRQVLGQDPKADLLLMEETYADRPDVKADILRRSGQNPVP